jgi:hypothetical protein
MEKRWLKDLLMDITEKDYDRINDRYIGSEYGDMRRERAALMKAMIFNNDASVKPRIRQLTLQMQQYMKARK